MIGINHTNVVSLHYSIPNLPVLEGENTDLNLLIPLTLFASHKILRLKLSVPETGDAK
ncbi:MAG TPA: hypothetical protein VFG46_22655 [Chryseolinea sp.]|nr:hypothetical protein [Chryseolinea sp.]